MQYEPTKPTKNNLIQATETELEQAYNGVMPMYNGVELDKLSRTALYGLVQVLRHEESFEERTHG